jgi:D-glycero-D-manno-heptose 1,7-bisphosphate phosphatase
MMKRVIFLDRDGTINVDNGYVTCKRDWALLPRVAKAIRLLRDGGYAIAVVSNQSAVAKGKCTIADIQELHVLMREELARHGAVIDAIAYCPHAAEDECGCRKPRTGMVAEIERQMGEQIDYSRSWTVGVR